MIGPYAGILLGALFAIFFYRAADYERIHPAAWAATSLGISVIISMNAGGIGMVVLGQIALFGLMWGYNIWRANRSGHS